ncbi:hypothetical protein AAFC00_006734 [Neodothiora populina]|uniref:Ubiquitin carboxyl-terminal hydrolase n=1 Tax=Neodothiora populina TaxID=2781224 RepID=A0ABR3PBD7_9PEZI
MPPKASKRRVNGLQRDSSDGTSPAPITPDRATWPAWCEVESEPAFFNTILHEINVDGVKVQEVLGLDDECLAILPKPVYAMIFLFKYTKAEEEGQTTSCPPNVWFANQVPEFACASVALLNIVMNLPDVRLGHELQNFKDSTRSLDPVSKGDAIASFDFVRNIHNSFARDMDMLNIDYLLKDKHASSLKKRKLEAANAAKAEKAAARAEEKALRDAANIANGASTPSRSNPLCKARATDLSEDADWTASEAFHFIAYMPIGDEVWKLDGMEGFPQSLGTLHESQDWLQIIQTELTARMLQYQEGQIEFSLMAVIKDPAIDDRTSLAENIKALHEITRRLDEVIPDWRAFTVASADESTILNANSKYGITDADIQAAIIPGSVSDKLKSDRSEILLHLRQDMITAQAACRDTLRDHSLSNQSDAIKAMHRRFDYSSFVNGWLDSLAEEDVLLSLLEKAQ